MSSVDLPNPLSPDKVKDTPAFGLNFMKKAHEKESNVNESYSKRKARYEYNRLFASGKQPMDEYKDILDLDGEESVIQLMYEPLPIAIPHLNRLYDRYMQRDEKIQCNAIDPLTQTKKEKAKDEALFKLKHKEEIQAIQQEAGVAPVEFKDDDPETETELEMQFGFNFKLREEVVMENGIDLVFYDNRWHQIIKKRILKDLVECGIAQVCPYIDSNGRIKIDFTKPEDIISSYTEWDDFRDCQYQGRYYMMSIFDIRMQYPKVVESMGGEQKLYDLSQSQIGKNGNPNTRYDWNYNFNDAIARPYDTFKVQVLDLSMKTLYNLKYELNKDRFGKETLDKAIKNRTREQQYLTFKPYEVEYAGCWIVGTEWLLDWGMAKNMVKPQDNLVEVKLPYITFMYDNNQMSNTPLIETMIPSIKMMQLIDLQQQKIIAAAAPDGYDVDISTSSDIDIGNGQGELNAFQLYKVYKQTGVRYFKRIGDDGDTQRTPPISANNVPFSAKLEQLMNKWNQEYDKLNKIIGDNDLAAGAIRNQAAGKSVLEKANQIAESASNYIYAGYLNIMERTASMVMMRLWDILVFGKKDGIHYYDGYRKALGSDKIEYIKIESDDDFEKTQFDVKVEAVTSDAEIQYFEQNIQAVLGVDPTMLPDVAEARRLAKTNMKYAIYFLMSRYQKRLKEKAEQVSQNNEEMRKANVAGAEAKTAGDMQLEQLKSQLKSQETKESVEAEKSKELIKFNSILKTKIVDGMLAQGLTIQQIQQQVPVIFEGIGLIEENSQQIIEEEIVANEQQQMAMEQQAIEEQQMAEQGIDSEQMMAQQGM